MSIVEWPGRDGEDEDCGSANEADVDGKFDVLQQVADEKGNGLGTNS